MTQAANRWVERNQAHLVVFRSADGDVRHDFEVDASGIVRVWETLRSKGALIMQGRLLPSNRMQLDKVGGHASHLVLERERPPQG